jgi:putative aminopeptidase FrvX
MKRKNKSILEPSDFLRELILAPGPAGFEDSAAACWRRNLETAGLQPVIDTYGNSIATINPAGATSVMLLAHIDTIGLMVKHIDESALICVSEIGGLDPVALIGQHVLVMTDPPLHGVIGRRPTHLESDDDKSPELHTLRVDVGASDPKELEDLVPIGTPIVFQPRLDSLLDNRICGTSLDDRIGAWCVAEAIKRLAKSDKLKVRIHAVASIQEETGLHGAHMAAEQLRPHLALGVDVTFAIDTPDLDKERYGGVVLGKGATIGIGGSSHPTVVRGLIHAAADAKIVIQREAVPNSDGCNEADAIFRTCGGVLTGLVMIPIRYMHTSVETIQLDDAESAVDLIVAWCESVV